MARPINKLSAPEVKAATYADRAYKVFDGGGLFLHVQSRGRYWRLKYRWGGRERLLSLGVYPRVSLAKARERRDEARKLIDDGIDPSARRKAEKAARNKPTRFEAVAREWLQKQTTLAPGTRTVTLRRWERWVFPHIGSTPIDRLEPADVLHVLRRIEAAGKHETAHRMRQRIGQVCRFAVASGRADRDPTGDLKDALAPVPRRNRAAITEPTAFGGLLRAMDGYDGQPSTKAALHLLALTFVRPGELRFAAWPEFDLEGAVWRIPGARMKMGREHIVPLAPEAVEHLRRLHPVTGHRPYVFEGNRPGRPISENTVNMALKTMGYSADQVTAHGFRSTASTLLHEMGWPPEVIELQLSHAQRSQVAAAYNRSARLEERQKMMLAWAEYLDKLRRDVKAPD
jgi:integrase